MKTQVDNVIESLEKLPDDKFRATLDRLVDQIDNLVNKKSPEIKKHFREYCLRIWGIEPAAKPSLPVTSAQAKRLQELSGLAVEHLAEIFAVPAVKYSQWVAGLPIVGEHRQQLLEVLVQVEEASTRLKTPEAMSAWLLAPAYEGGKRPLDYLATGEYGLFRVLFLRIRTGQEAFLPPLPRRESVNPFMTEMEFDDAYERLVRGIRYYDEDYPDSEETTEAL